MCMITIQKNQMMIEQYEEVIHVTIKEIRLRLKDSILTITGDHLQVLALSKDECLLEGTIEGLLFSYEA